MNTVGLSDGGLGVAGPEPDGAVLTAARLAEAWPEVSERLAKLLACRGVDPVLAQDIVQDVAVRALDKRVPFTDPDDLYRWAAVAARNLHIDHMRTGRVTTEVETLAGVPDDTDVAYAVERRLALGHVWRAIAVMRPGERDAIIDSLHEHPARTSGALVRRHRARATLKKAVGGMIAVVSAARVRLRVVSPALRTAGAVAVVTPVLVLDLGAGVLAHGAATRDVSPRTTRLVSVVTVSSDARDTARSYGRMAGGATRLRTGRAAAPRDPYVARVTPISDRGDTHVAGPGGTGIDHTHEPNQSGALEACLTDVPDVGDVCTPKIPLPNL